MMNGIVIDGKKRKAWLKERGAIEHAETRSTYELRKASREMMKMERMGVSKERIAREMEPEIARYRRKDGKTGIDLDPVDMREIQHHLSRR